MSNPKPFYVNIAGAFLVVCLLILGFLTWYVWSSYWGFRSVRADRLRVESGLKQISELDQFLTTFARFGATTGDKRWEEHYTQFFLRRDKAMQTVEKLAGKIFDSKDASKMNEAKFAVSDQESSAFDLARKGRLDLAESAVYGETYEKQKELYSGAFDAISQKVQAGFKQQLQMRENIARQAILFGGLFIPVFALLHIILSKILNLYYAGQLNSILKA